MPGRTSIEWATDSWNPVTGCSKVSEGCRHCYAEALALRFGRGTKPWSHPHAAENVTLHPERLPLPLRWRAPRRVFVNSVSDLFHELVPDEFVGRVFGVMSDAQQHTFMVLTKRPRRMAELLNRWAREGQRFGSGGCRLPLRNVWLGTSVEDQRAADGRIPHLLATPAAVRFLSCEPLLGPLDLTPSLWERAGPEWAGWNPCPDIGWVIAGGESGPKARPMHPGWARSLRDQCVEAGVPFFFKQWGEWAPIVTPEGYVRSEGAGRLGAVLDGNGWRTFRRGEEHGDVFRIGKKAAGRVLDGREWDGMPEVIAR